MKKFLKIAGIVLGVLLLIVLAYVAYVFIDYDRIEDNQELAVEGNAVIDAVSADTEYTVVTQNIGFGAYTADFTFFMDGGESSWAESEESVVNCVNGIAKNIDENMAPDFILFQEVDFDSTRSYHVDQKAMLCDAFDGYDEVFAVNYHSAFLMYPFTEPHGASNSGILTMSQSDVTSALRRSFPISTGFSKFLDLDRCYSVSRIAVENGKELVLYNVHSSAYGGDDAIRAGQMGMLFDDMASEYAKGNYVVAGGDFNHDFTGSSTQDLNDMEDNEFGWAQPFPAEMLPDGISRCVDYTVGADVPTSRNCDVPYSEDSVVFILDGFLVSDNVEVTYLENVDAQFEYTDHNPVLMRFKLLAE
ncbi:MAG: endonuclease/exonuclease/phosphatase family protein [Firmicutes bacterium]|nr:endonuclease/exonuclease/phosphatase family protein [Bacillota bacterium]